MCLSFPSCYSKTLKGLNGLDIEKYGLTAVPRQERTATWFDLFIIWSGVNICMPSFIVGALLIPAFAWGAAVQVNFWGNFIVGMLIVLGGYFGVRTGKPSVRMIRHVFGRSWGQLLPTIALLASTLGWYAVMTVLTAMALAELAEPYLGMATPLVIILVGLLNASTAVAGFHKIRWFNRLIVPLLGVFCIFLAYKLLSQMPPALDSYRPTGTLLYGEGIDLIIGSFLAGAFAASDFSRYARSNLHNWLGTFPGAFLLSFLLGLLGMYSVVVTGEWNPVLVVSNLGMGMPALLFILLANWTTNHNLLYSSGLALLNIFPCLERWKSTMICGIFGTLLALTGIAAHLESWLTMLSYVFSPLLGVVLAELLVVCDRRSTTGINYAAFVAAATGMLVEIVLPPQYIASIVGLVTAAFTYILIKRLFRRDLWRKNKLVFPRGRMPG